jgi:hypothetical protein
VISYGALALSDARIESSTDEELVLLLIKAGASRLTAERIVAIARDGGEVGRARRHMRVR